MQADVGRSSAPRPADPEILRRTVSEENVEIVRRLFEASARRDSATVLSFYDSDAVVDNTHGPARALMGSHRIYRGHEGLRRMFREWYDAWEDVEANLVELIERGDRVISVQVYRGRGRASGVQVEWPDLAGIWTLREGRVVQVVWYPTRAEALEAAKARDRVGTVRAVYDEWGQGNLRAGLELYDRRLVFMPLDIPDGGPDFYVGPEGVTEFMRGWLKSWRDFTIAAEEYIEAGDSVVVMTRQHGAGRASGAPAELVYFQVWTFRGHSVIRLEQFRKRAEALAAVGLSE
jgi:ketosteroid isomerase-like protein